MKGKVLLFDYSCQKGVIVDKNKNHYHFHIGEWLSEEPIEIGKDVVFDMPREEAFNVQVKEEKDFFSFCLKIGKKLFQLGNKQKVNKEEIM